MQPNIHTEARCALLAIRPIALEVEDMLSRLPALLKDAARHPDEVVELGLSLSDARSRLMDFERAVREGHSSSNRKIEALS